MVPPRFTRARRAWTDHVRLPSSIAAQPGAGPRSSWAFSTWLFLRLLGVVYFFAFWSLDSQILGLAGSQGIAPAQAVMAQARAWAEADQIGWSRFVQWPTVYWLGVNDAWLTGVCRLGMLVSLPLALGVGSVAVLPLLWLLYLSLATVTGEFLAFQWDSLLLETGAVAIALAPWTLVERPGRQQPPRVARWLVWWLLFRLMLASGIVKMTSGDPLWRGLTALTVHYETQPLPTPLAWYAHQLPAWFQQLCTALVLAIELVVPWFILGGVRWKRVAAATFVMLQTGIALTGNYAFFNVLSVSLVVTLIDDAAWHRILPGRGTAQRVTPSRRWQWMPAAILAALIVPVSLDITARQAGLELPGSAWTLRIREALLPLRSVNAYGLFAVMTPTRPEITIEGSLDGTSWQPYMFRYKLDDPSQRPRWVAPHQPRLDWQMWFAALGEADDSTWFEPLCRRLLEGSPDVIGLLAKTPFPNGPPRYIRATRAQWHMTTWAEHAVDGHWWTRGTPRPFVPLCGAPREFRVRF